jgi:arylsulfatase A-like enzyme
MKKNEQLTEKSTEADRPNLLFVFADQMRGMDMRCAGNDQMITPHLDRLAKGGIRFSNAISTYPLCCPARASLMTGKYPLSHGVVTNGPPLPETETTIGEILKDKGYQTGYIGKWHLNGHPGMNASEGQFVPPGPKRHGFDYWAAANFSHEYSNSFYYQDKDAKIRIEGWEPDTQTDLAIRFIEERRRESPFCLFLSWGPPHDPYTAPENFRKLYDPDKIKLRENAFLADKSIIATYYAAITSLDWNLGRLLDTIDRLGIAENTIIVFTSDHGDQLFSLYLFCKQWPYEETINVPFILRYPRRLKGGEVSDLLMGTPDILPTLLTLCGVKIPPSVEGRDLSSFILGQSTEAEPDSLLIEVINPCAVVQDRTGMRAWRGVRTKRYTYARFRDGDWLLIDNVYDPFQRRNLIYNAEFQGLRNELAGKLDEWLKKTDDPFLSMSAYRRYEMIHNTPPLLQK